MLTRCAWTPRPAASSAPGVPAILNPQDANALSAAMKVKETYGGEITLITMGPPNAEAVLRECLAVGADKAVLVTDRAFGNADTLATSYSILSAANTQGSYDMIFCGKEIARRRHRSDGRTACPALRRFSGDGHAAHRKL